VSAIDNPADDCDPEVQAKLISEEPPAIHTEDKRPDMIGECLPQEKLVHCRNDAGLAKPPT